MFSTWDLAGQNVYYVTHQCFLSRNTLYLVVWSMENGKEDIESLRPWLLNIQVSYKYLRDYTSFGMFRELVCFMGCKIFD